MREEMIFLPLQAEFSEHMVRFREHRRQKDEVLEGGWYTEERMKVDLKYSPKLSFSFVFFSGCDIMCLQFEFANFAVVVSLRNLINKVKAYCVRFESILTRQELF